MKNWNEYWDGMPRFNQNKKTPFAKCKVLIGVEHLFIRFENEIDFNGFIENGAIYESGAFRFRSRQDLSIAAKQKITEKTKSIWYPFKSHWGGITEKYISNSWVKNRYPVYIVSKGRWDNGLTTKSLSLMGVDHYLVVEADEVDMYQQSKSDRSKIIELPKSYLDSYNTCDNIGISKSRGPGAARNFCIDHSAGNGFRRHWVMDDNIDAFHYLTDNEKLEVECADTIAATEDFIDRFENVPVAGMNYYSFCKTEDKVPAFNINTRIYSCILMDNDSGYRWRGRYNEDTDLSLRVLKDGLCTIQMNAFLCGKVTTQRMRGGNSKEFYDEEGTLPKSQMIADLHPDVAKVVWRFNRWHHHVNYKHFSGNSLKLLGDKNDRKYNLYKVHK